MRYQDNIRDYKSKKILENGEVLYLGCYDYPNGAVWLCRYKDKYYKITHDGTGNEFFASQAPEELTKEEAISVAYQKNKIEEAIKFFGWEQEEVDQALGL